MKKWKRKRRKEEIIKESKSKRYSLFITCEVTLRVRVPFASKSCSAVTAKQHSGNGEGCEDEGKDAGVRGTLWTYYSLNPTWRLEPCHLTGCNSTWRVKIPPLLPVGWISTDLQAGSLGGQWWIFLWNFLWASCETQVSHHSWASSNH